MIITVESMTPPVLVLTFTKKELEHELFKTVMNKLYRANDLDAHKEDETVTIQLDGTYRIIGEQVDTIRELWCGDVTYTYKEELTTKDGQPIPDKKDLTNCPCFIIGETEPEPETVEEEVKEPDLTPLETTEEVK